MSIDGDSFDTDNDTKLVIVTLHQTPYAGFREVLKAGEIATLETLRSKISREKGVIDIEVERRLDL